MKISIYNKFLFRIASRVMGWKVFYTRTPFIPLQVQELYALSAAGDHAEAKQMFFDRYELYALSAPGRSGAALKYPLELLGFRMGSVRPPLERETSEITRRACRGTLDKHGLVTRSQ